MCLAPKPCYFDRLTKRSSLERLSEDVQHAIFESRLLDDMNTAYESMEKKKILSNWHTGNDHGTNKFWHSYLVHRVRNETCKIPQRRYTHIRLIAELVCQETSADVETTIESLCWPALQQATDPHINSRLETEPPNNDLDLLCAAAYLNLTPLAKRLLQEGHDPYSKSIIFSSPMKLAAWAGNSQMLKMFQDHSSETEATFLLKEETETASIHGAALRGDVEILRLAIYPPSWSAQADTNSNSVNQVQGALKGPILQPGSLSQRNATRRGM